MYKEEDILRAVCGSIDEVILAIDPSTRSIVHCNPAVRKGPSRWRWRETTGNL